MLFASFTALLMLPWLWPSTWGPLTNAVPWMVSAACGLFALLLSSKLSSGERALGIACSLVGAASISAVIAWLQWLNLESNLSPWVAQASAGMAYGNLRQPNQLASLLALGLWAGLWLWQLFTQQRQGRMQHAVFLLYLCLITSALVATASRVGLLHLVMLCLACGTWWILHRHKSPAALQWLLWSVSGLAFVFLWTTLTPLFETYNSSAGQRDLLERIASAESTCGSRRLLWGNVFHLIALNPWTGWGWGNLDWAHYMAQYPADRFCHILDHAHNLPLHLAVELGVPLTLLACLLLAHLIFKSKPWYEQVGERKMAWGLLLVIATHSLVEYPLWYGGFQIITLAALSILWPSSPFLSKKIVKYFCLIATLVLIYAAWDYWRISQIFLPSEKRSTFFTENTLQHAKQSILFQSTVEFAEFSITPVTASNSGYMLQLGQKVLHYSPEPNVVKKIIESARLSGNHIVLQKHMLRFKLAYPQDYQHWLNEQQPFAKTN